MNIDVFISYEHKSKSIADSIVSSFEKDKIRCWYAPRDVIGDYATSIVEAIESTSVFILILSGDSSNSPHVLNEVEMAYKKNIEQSQAITIIPFRVSNDELSRAMEYYIKRMHWIDATTNSLEAAITDLKKKVKRVLGIQEEVTEIKANERIENKYFTSDDTKEIRRLQIQETALRAFDGDIYLKASDGFETVNALDLGSNFGKNFFDRFSQIKNLKTAVGIEYDAGAVEYANQKYGSQKFKFYQCDVESEQFTEVLNQICEELSVENFQIINISMLLLHLKRPHNLLKIIRKFLSPGGYLIIRDIDDGFNVAYPDREKIFEQTINYCSESEFSGYRKSGREIYTMLKDTGFKNIKLENLGLSTAGMDYDEREALFDTYFGFITDDIKRMQEKYPDSEHYKEALAWLQAHGDRLESEFMRDDFFFVLGFMLFSARK